jgi:ATP synthase F1 gamma subunit
MRRPPEILSDERAMRTIVSLTSAFESLSSMQIIATKRNVEKSNVFFNDVWNIYKNIRVNGMFQFGRNPNEKPIDKELYILITAQSSLSGDIDARLIRLMRKNYDPEKHDIVVIGRHGAQQLTQLGIQYKKYFTLPKKDPIYIEPLISIVRKYRETRVFYQNYVSLMVQDVKSLPLSEVVETKGEAANEATKHDDMITEDTYIFEPNPLVVVAHMEMSMMRLTLMQMIYNSRLAQHASRFKAMSLAKQNASDSASELHSQYNRAKRNLIDQRLKEVAAGLKKTRISNGRVY